ncbi:hypothetical protein CSHISOI_05587 [Colletotrichum shisoi]|uniref:Uncharacterized protein n=1 Tax=Colletotrichum shisoi TaxID=2078593 RepID=A0A5Q4BS75_9PEZI|nr:hypothetical protein CSHISOI_05587 [Colletotrichum shisoi]
MNNVFSATLNVTSLSVFAMGGTGDVVVSYEELALPREMQGAIVNYAPRLRYLELSILDRSEYFRHGDYVTS